MSQATLDRGAARPSHRIPPPTGEREPLKANVFERMQSANTELVPIFPYYGHGAFVPCGALFKGEPGLDMGHFFHNNTVDEVVCVFGGNNAMLQTGQVIATPKLHGVNTFLKKPQDPESFLVIAITQRQSDDGDQREALLFRCAKCHEHLLDWEFTSTPKDQPGDRYPEFVTLTEGVEPAEKYNADEAIRTCSKCGYLNPPFPLELWGWKKWAVQQRTVNDARKALLAKADAQLGERD